jgi:cobalt-zinc-cadmium efflux system outer membrane protein
MNLLLAHGLAALTIAQGADSLTLDQALARARAARPRLAAAAAAVVRARGTSSLGALVPNPVAQVELDRTTPTTKATITQSLAWLPRRAADLAAGRAGVERARWDSVQATADIGRDVRRAFFGALAADRQLVLAVEQRTFADSLAGVALRRATAGDISDLERDQVRLEAARARLASAQADESAQIARAELARAVAWDGAQLPRASGALDEGLGTDGSEPPDTAPGVGELPSVRAAVADSTAAAARLRAARIARVPIPGLMVGRETTGGSDDDPHLILGFAIPVPLWSWGGEAVTQARGAAAEQAALAAESRLAARALLQQMDARVAESTRRARFARDTLLPESQRIRAGAVRLYDAGQTSVLPVLDALRAERAVAREAVGELLTFQQARADRAAALGRWP